MATETKPEGFAPRDLPAALKTMGDEAGSAQWQELVDRNLSLWGVLDDEVNDRDVYTPYKDDAGEFRIRQWRQGKSGRWHHLATWEHWTKYEPHDWCYNYEEGLEAGYHEDECTEEWRDIWGLS